MPDSTRSQNIGISHGSTKGYSTSGTAPYNNSSLTNIKSISSLQDFNSLSNQVRQQQRLQQYKSQSTQRLGGRSYIEAIHS